MDAHQVPEQLRDGARRRPTLQDVAALAAVSVTTASRALTGRGRVASSTRLAVRAAADQLGFSPNPLAQSLLDGQTRTIGLITSDLDGRFSLPVLMGAEDAFGDRDFAVFLSDSRGDAARERRNVQAMLARRVDGLIIVAADMRDRDSLGDELPVPVIYALGASRSSTDRSVVVDNEQAGRIGIEHLATTGRRRILYVGGDPSLQGAADRLRGVEGALRAHGMTLAAAPESGAWTEQWGRQALRRFIAEGVLFDAVMCGSDHIARGVLDVLREVGRSVPIDVAVLGHDNFPVLAEHSEPPLSSIDMNLGEVGAQAARTLLRAIQTHDAERRTIEVQCFVVPRGTT